ncbi:MAG: IMP dehydrogenase [Armatimonadetes bacterium]|nr:IMP dehydrogenase [Armatimonadota bacterium]
MEKFIGEGLTFNDVLLVPEKSEILPLQVDLSANLTFKIKLKIPLVSAAMDTVTEAKLAIAIAREGGIGIIHRNLSIKEQAEEVDKVKRWESGMIKNPITLSPNNSLKEAIQIMEDYHISGIPITENGKLAGILTNRDIRFEQNFNQEIKKFMTKENLITVKIGTTLEQAQKILHKHKIEKLPVVDENFKLKGLITVKDIQKKKQFPLASKDNHGRLLVGAAVGVGDDAEERLQTLIEKEVDVVVIDTAHGHSTLVIDFLKKIKKKYDIELISVNIVTEEAVEELIKAGADAVKVGMGPGSICTTRVIAGTGVPQITAIYNCYKVAKKYKIPIIADGGIIYSGDITKALCAGADAVMMGSIFAGTDESPGEVVLYGGERFKEYRGMGSLGAMKLYSRDRYFQSTASSLNKLVPEGIEARVPYKGAISNVIYQLIGGLRSGMGYLGAKNIIELKKRKFIKVTGAGVSESHPHNVEAIKEAPNYMSF